MGTYDVNWFLPPKNDPAQVDFRGINKRTSSNLYEWFTRMCLYPVEVINCVAILGDSFLLLFPTHFQIEALQLQKKFDHK